MLSRVNRRLSEKERSAGSPATGQATGGRVVNYAQEQQNTGFSSNMKTVLYLPGLVGDHAEAFSGSPELFFDRAPVPRPPKWQNGPIIPYESNSPESKCWGCKHAAICLTEARPEVKAARDSKQTIRKLECLRTFLSQMRQINAGLGEAFARTPGRR